MSELIVAALITGLLGAVTGWVSNRGSKASADAANTKAAAEEWKRLADDARERLGRMEERADAQDKRMDRMERALRGMKELLRQVLGPLRWIRAGAIPPPPTVDHIIHNVEIALEEESHNED